MGYNAPKQTVSQFQLKGRYARQYLSFAGKSSKDFLLYLSGPGVYDSPAADVESTSVPGRNGDIITENARTGRRRYQNVDIKYKAFFFNGLPAKTAAVKAWRLSPIGFRLLSVSILTGGQIPRVLPFSPGRDCRVRGTQKVWGYGSWVHVLWSRLPCGWPAA